MIKSTLIFIHLMSFATSFGLVLFCDLIMAQVPLKGAISSFQLKLLERASKVIMISLGGLILSGLGFLLVYWLENPEALSNPKLYAKMTVVTILSVNGFWLHRSGLKILKGAQKENLLRPSQRANLKKLVRSGALSGISWWTAFGLGAFRELNFVVSFSLLLGLYIVAVASAFIVIEIGFLYLSMHKNKGMKPSGI